MALIIDISINRRLDVLTLSASRISGDEKPDSFNTYKVESYNPKTDEIKSHGTVRHRYGDDAVELVNKVVAQYRWDGDKE